MQTNKPWYYEHLNFFEGLDKEAKETIEKIAAIKKFKKGQIIATLDTPCKVVYILKKGRAEVYLLSFDGKKIILAIRKPGDILGLTTLCGFRRRMSYVSALEDLETLSIDVDNFEKFIMNNIILAGKIIRILGARLHHSRMIIEDLGTKNVKDRLVRVLLNLSQDFGHDSNEGIKLDINLTHEQFSQIIASSRQTVTIALNLLESEGLIKRQGKNILIVDQKILESFLSYE